jgi:hypothetical protein
MNKCAEHRTRIENLERLTIEQQIMIEALEERLKLLYQIVGQHISVHTLEQENDN